MVRRQHPQRSIFELILPDGDQLWDPELRRIDQLLDDEVLIEQVEQALHQRRPQSRWRGRPGTPAAVVLRLLVLKHLYDWSFADCEREVRGSLIHRAFCRIDCERVPDDKTLIRLAQALGPETLKALVQRLVEMGRQRQVVRGRKLRVDTTVVETNIHHPTDSSLLGDGVRVITRTVQKIRPMVQVRFRDRTRSVRRRVFQIVQQSRKVGEKAQAEMKKLYRRLMGTTRAVAREAQKALGQAQRQAQKLAPRVRQKVQGLHQQVKQMSQLTQRVLEQTKARVVKGDTRHPDKVLSMFETHTEAIRKGKKVKPTEFGKLVKVQEAENQIITDYEVCAERVEDGKLWDSSLERHEQIFGGPPQVATADAGFSSAANEETARARGVRHVALPWRAPLGRAPGTSKATLVSPGAALAHGMRRADQRPQTTPRTGPLSLSRPARDGTV